MGVCLCVCELEVGWWLEIAAEQLLSVLSVQPTANEDE